MKAWVLHDINDIRSEDIEKPVPNKEEVLVKVKACGICGSDIPRIFKTGAHVHPIVPGHEFSGEVVDSADEAGKGFIGKRVGIFPLIPCMNCGPCKNKQYEMCRKYDYLGSRSDGGFAEYVSVPKWNLIELPDNVSFEAAAMLEPMAVAVHAMRRAIAGRTLDIKISVIGLGTIGLLLVMFLKEAGYDDLYVVGNKAFQKKKALELGIKEDHYIDSKDAADEMTGKMDVVFEVVGKNDTLKKAIRFAAPSGYVLTVGNPAGDMSLDKSEYWKILRDQLTVRGTWNSSFTKDVTDDWHYVLDRISSGRIAPESLITHKFPLEDLMSGLSIMKDKTEDYVKIMTVTD